MKLIAATVRNYRKHRDLTVSFDDNLVLLHGSNESGKSTLAEAIHCALFLKAKGSTEAHKAMLSVHGGTPEVEIIFDARGRRHTLRKTFSPTQSKAVLEVEGEATLTGDAVEEQLANLLGVEGAAKGRGVSGRLLNRWGHLWVWQGLSSQSPLESMTEVNGELRSQLLSRTGTAFLSSETDLALVESLEKWVSQNFLDKGTPRKGSELEKRIQELDTAEQTARTADASWRQLSRTIEEFQSASEAIQRHQSSLKQSEEQSETVNEQLAEVEGIRVSMEKRKEALTRAAEHLQTAQTEDARIRGYEASLAGLREEAEPQSASLETCRLQIEARRTRLSESRFNRDKLRESLDRMEKQVALWQAHVQVLKLGEAVAALRKKRDAIDTLREELATQDRELAPLRAFTEEALKALRYLERQVERSSSELNAHAVELEIGAAVDPVAVDGQGLSLGEKRLLTANSEITIGEGTRLLLRLGSVADRDRARDAFWEAKRSYHDALDALGVADLSVAERKAAERDRFQRERESLAVRLESLHPEAVASELQEGEEQVIQLSERRDHLCDSLAMADLPVDLTEAIAVEEAELRLLKERRADWNRCVASCEDEERGLLELEKQLKDGEDGACERKDAIRDLELRLGQATEINGDAITRAQRIREAQVLFTGLESENTRDLERLETLGAEGLAIQKERLESAIQSDKTKLEEARRLRTLAEGSLRRDGATDPEGDLQEAVAKREALKSEVDRLQRQGQLRKDLLERLREARRRTVSQLAQPLEAAAAPYLELIFGTAKVRLEWADDGSGLESIHLDRTAQSAGHHAFESLSHGTREQVSLAFRLAVAELLASNHDGCLPMVLDDAFTHADDQRADRIKNLLYRASRNQVQVLIFSCHPQRYSGLGASEVLLGA